MPKKVDYNDIVGQKFGELTVLEVTDERRGNDRVYRCRCTCGREKRLTRSELRRGLRTSCAHGKLENPNDIVGRRFEKLVVEKYIGMVGKHRLYECVCDCGKHVQVFRDNLFGGNTKSCGECNIHIEPEEDYYRYFCDNGESFIFDACDLELVKAHRWYMHYGYPKTNVGDATVPLSRMILGEPEDVFVDHISMDTTDNRRCNLRVASCAENCRNVGMRKNNKSGYKGVSLHRQSGKYRVDIGFEGRIIYCGLYSTAEEAALAADEAMRKYHGEFARLNFPREGERGCRKAG